MNWDDISGHWKQNKSKVKEKWGRLTENDLAIISGMRSHLTSLLQKKYDLRHEQAEMEVDRFAGSIH